MNRKRARVFTLLAVALSVFCLACTAAKPGAEVAPQESTFAVIVQGSDFEAVTAAVLNVGGTITHELKIIRAVGARLTATQRADLEQDSAVSRIYEDRKVEVKSGGPPTMGDRFKHDDYDNDDGSVPWSGDWQELGESDGAREGDVKIKGAHTLSFSVISPSLPYRIHPM